MRPMAAISGSSTASLGDYTYWQAEKQLLPPYLRTSDNTRRILHYKVAVRDAIKSQLSCKEREYIRLFYEERLTKTKIGELHGIGSSAVCKTLKNAEKKIRKYVELYMQIYKMLENEAFDDEDDMHEICGGQTNYAKHRTDR